MQEILDQVYGYLRGVWRRRWVMLAMAWFLAVVGWVVVLKMPDQYSSEAKVYVDTQSVLRPLLQGLAVQSNLSQQVELMTRTLFTRPNLEKVARMTDLDLKAENEIEMGAILNSIKDRVSLSGSNRQNIYTIGFEDNNPEVAKNVVQAFLTIFVESSLGSSRKDSDVATKFLDDQIKEYEQRLLAAENRVKEFKQKNFALLSGSGGDYFSRLKISKSELEQASNRLDEVVRRRDEIQRQMAGEEPTFGLAPSANVFSRGMSHPLDSRIAEMEKRKDELLLKYTEKHPDVVSLTDTLERLKETRRQELEEAKANLPEDVAEAPPLQQNPVYQQLKISLGQAEAEVASLEVRVNKLRSEVKKLESLVDTVPAVEAEMKALNRDYEIVKKNYEQLLQRKESARMAQQAEATGDSVQFKVLEPPRVPNEPSGPNRSLFLSIVLVAGLGAGVVVALLLSQLKATFDNRTMLRSATEFPVLGTVSMEWTPAQRVKMRVEVIVFTVLTFSLLLAYGMAILFQDQGVNLMARLG